MATAKQLDKASTKTGRSTLNQLVDIIELNCSESVSVKGIKTFITGGAFVGPGVSSSIKQEIYDKPTRSRLLMR